MILFSFFTVDCSMLKVDPDIVLSSQDSFGQDTGGLTIPHTSSHSSPLRQGGIQTLSRDPSKVSLCNEIDAQNVLYRETCSAQDLWRRLKFSTREGTEKAKGLRKPRHNAFLLHTTPEAETQKEVAQNSSTPSSQPNWTRK